MKDTRTPTQYPAGVSRRKIEQAVMSDQDALRAEAGKLAAESAAASDATSWFELLYQAAARGEATIPWASLAPNPHLVQWARARPLRGTGRTALVVGCGFGDDAEFVASPGFGRVAFRLSPTAPAAPPRRLPRRDGRRRGPLPGPRCRLPPGRPADPARLVAGRLRPRRGDLHRPATPRHRPDDRRVHAATPGRPRRHPPDHRPRDRAIRPRTRPGQLPLASYPRRNRLRRRPPPPRQDRTPPRRRNPPDPSLARRIQPQSVTAARRGRPAATCTAPAQSTGTSNSGNPSLHRNQPPSTQSHRQDA